MSALRTRLFAAILAAVLASLAVTVAIGAVLQHRTADRSTAASVARRANLLARQEGQEPSYINLDFQDGSTRVIARRLSEMKAFLPAGASVTARSNGKLKLAGETYLYSYRPIPPRGLLVLSARVASPVWGPFLRDLLLAGVFGTGLAAVIAFLLARSIASPIRRVAAASRALARGASPGVLPVGGSAELSALASAFNEMAAELAASRESERTFLLSVSHELKTPLTAIRGYAEGVVEGAFTPADAIGPILVEARRLERLVRDLLELARMNRRAFSVRREEVDLAQVAAEAVARHRAAARSFGVSLHALGGPSRVVADHDRVLQVASNLVENALRQTPPGGTVSVRSEEGRLVVADTGPGLDPEDLPRAFDRFFLYDKYGRERPVGSGLGLAIVKQLALAMGGDVTVASAPGEGATFTLELPRGPAAPARGARAGSGEPLVPLP
ncbi:MAG TPA: HAMP domain-containing sensor histidine kinase [Gaiellaceae bacterium]|nr:HAMP domain-containing sensor histidine kinase [Gaiellaceae bacterium]